MERGFKILIFSVLLIGILPFEGNCQVRKNSTDKLDSLFMIQIKRLQVDPRAIMAFLVTNPETGLVEKSVVEARRTFYKDITLLALPSEGPVSKERVIDLTENMISHLMIRLSPGSLLDNGELIFIIRKPGGIKAQRR